MSDISEKNGSEDRIDDIEKVANSRGSATPVDAHYDPKFVKKTLLMIDWRMLPLLGLLYAIALVDRTNMGVARTAGMLKDLRLDIGERYSIASMIYFVPYIILQIPANLVLRKLGAQTFLTICVVGWGAAQVGMGFVTNWGLLCVTRVLLGIFEAGFFPALVFIITTWYKRHEVQKRLAVFYLCSIVIGGFSSILAYGITFLKGKGGLNGWQWIFVLEGILTILLGVLTWMFVPDFPDKARFLNDNQRKMILDRIEADRADSMPDKMTRQKFFAAFFDPLTWSFAIMFMASTMPAYAIGFFSTIIINGMGYSAAMALLLTAFPYVAAAISCFFFAWLADKTRMRAVWLAAQNVICIIGLMCTGYTSSPGVRYFGLFFINMGASGCVPGVLAYHSNNITQHSKRAVSTATIIAMGGVGGIFATTVYRQEDYPRYIPGIWATMACQFTMLTLLAINSFVFARRNRLHREGKRGPPEGTPGFSYTI
ncbi:major facilitator superfamily domain-containing protein [Ephemerocybe angulata]|uniref:Major facilitator superfamily domain-containing protein n=1 Tax=Ephemerocybe angulata TaxID=980116 RepID=A0A8H6M2U4_9AGAR|nr:major facilitator superfamily domain-containing protein [Tulosesus angulatus]